MFIALASLVSPGDIVLSENADRPWRHRLGQVLGFTLKGPGLRRIGIHPDHFEDMCANEADPGLVRTPNFNNPTVSLMPPSRRAAIARIAEKYGFAVIEG